MKKKFKRLVKTKTAAKNKGCRIMSAFLAAAVFVSGGVFGTLAKSGFTVAEEEYVSTDEYAFEEIPFESDVNFLAASGNDVPVIKIVPQINLVPDLKNDHVDEYEPIRDSDGNITGYNNVWETNAIYYDVTDNKDKEYKNTYILRGKDSVTIFGVTNNFETVNSSNDDPKTYGYEHIYEAKDSNGNTVYVATDAYIWIADEKYGTYGDKWGDQKNLLRRDDEVTYKINAKGQLEVYTKIDSNITDDTTVINAWAVFNNGLAKNSDNSWQELYISARPKNSFIQVYSKVGDRDMNEVNEYVYDANITPQQKLNVSGQYENGEIDLNSLCILNNFDTPYLLHPGESVYIKGLGNPIKDNLTFVKVKDQNGSDLNNSDQKCTLDNNIDSVNVNGEYIKCTVEGDGGRYCLTYNTGHTDQNGKPVYEKFYIWNYNRWLNYYDHADIEISDENTYTVDKLVWETDEKGAPVQRNYRIVYDVYVSGVDHSQILHADNTPVVLKDQYYKEGVTVPWTIGPGFGCNSNRLTGPRKDEQGIIPGTDYWKDPTKSPGDKQFELTSKYERTADTNELIYSSINDNLRFTMTEVGKVDFYVDLYLKPKSVTVYDEQNNVYKDSATYNIADLSTVTIPGVVFNMDHQSVIDAFNKCPDHSGLDFTFAESIGNYIEIDLANTSFEATKVLLDKDSKQKELKPKQFEFELFYVRHTYTDENGQEITDEPEDPISLGKVLNDKDGKVIFDNRNFSQAGTYTYWIKEVTENPIDNIEYDYGYIEVTVEVSSVLVPTSDGKQKVSLSVDSTTYKKYKADGSSESEVKFTNTDNTDDTKYYTLPSAGGPGVNMYIISGAGLMLIAAGMYRRKRKGGAIL